MFSRLGYISVILPIKSDNLIDVSTVRFLGGIKTWNSAKTVDSEWILPKG